MYHKITLKLTYFYKKLLLGVVISLGKKNFWSYFTGKMSYFTVTYELFHCNLRVISLGKNKKMSYFPVTPG